MGKTSGKLAVKRGAKYKQAYAQGYDKTRANAGFSKKDRQLHTEGKGVSKKFLRWQQQKQAMMGHHQNGG